MRRLILLPILLLPLTLGGCLGGGALMALSAAGGAAGIAKDVFDIDVDIHDLIGSPKPAQPISPVQAVTHPALLLDGSATGQVAVTNP